MRTPCCGGRRGRDGPTAAALAASSRHAARSVHHVASTARQCSAAECSGTDAAPPRRVASFGGCSTGPALGGPARTVTTEQTLTPATLVPAPLCSTVRSRHNGRSCLTRTRVRFGSHTHGIVGYAYACIYDAPAPSVSPVACCQAVSTETSAARREAQTAMTRLAIAAAGPGADVSRSSHSSSTARRSTRTYADGSGCGAQDRAERGSAAGTPRAR